ncbi:MAG: hypothetical protein ACSLFN_01890, partial [Candidatus Limnocylindrales bacterium]
MTMPSGKGLNRWRRQELIWALRWLAGDPEAAIGAYDGIVTAGRRLESGLGDGHVPGHPHVSSEPPGRRTVQRRRDAMGVLLIAFLVVGCATDFARSARPDAVIATPTLPVDATTLAMPTASPAPTLVATMAPPPPELVTVEPVEGTTLPLAARDGAPGLIACGALRPTPLEAIVAVPNRAETRIGPEYDILRETIARYGDDTEFGFRGQTFREFRLDATNVAFLGSNDEPEGPYSSIDVELSN